jgi:hypothetical protein
MSDGYDGYDGGTEASHVDAGQENYELDHGAQAYGNENDHSLEHNQYGEATSHEADVNYNQGHAVEYDSPAGAHFAEQDYTNYNAHEADSSAAYGESLSESDHSEAFGQLETLHEQLESGHFEATHFETPGYQGPELEGGGEQHLSAVDK